MLANAKMEVAAIVLPGFEIYGFLPAFWGAIVLSLINLVLRAAGRSLADDGRHQRRQR